MKNIHPLLDKKKQEKAKIYEHEKRKIGIFSLIITLLFQLFFYYSGLSFRLSHPVGISSGFIILILYIFAYSLMQDIITLPFSFISGYNIEHKYGFSRQTISEWFWDHAKSFLLSLLFSFIVIGVLLFLFNKFPEIWWLYASGFVILFSVVLSTIFPVLILPIFHNYDKIEDKELKESLKEILGKTNINIEGFYSEDTSTKTSRENAMLAGMGRTKRVILADNVLNSMKPDEIKAVLAHEVGHHKKSHMLKMIITGTVLQVLLFFLMHKIMVFLFPGFLGGFQNNLELLPMFLLFLEIMDLSFLKLLNNWISRYLEIEADRVALELIDSPESFKRAMAGLANRNLSNAYPSLWVKLLYYDHPPIGERLRLAENFD